MTYYSASRFSYDALSAIRPPGQPAVTSNTAGTLLPIDQTNGYWSIGGASPQQSAFDVNVESVSGPVTFAVVVTTDPGLGSYVAVAQSGPVTAAGRVSLAVARQSIDAALASLAVAVDVSGGGVSTPTPARLTVLAIVPGGSSVAWSANESQLVG